MNGKGKGEKTPKLSKKALENYEATDRKQILQGL